ncbi:hypothetical protein ACTFIW_003013 [Dictyostelium discoideum]
MKFILTICLLLIFNYLIGISFGNQQQQQQILNQQDSMECPTCLFIIGYINELRRQLRTEKEIIKILIIQCNFVADEDACEQNIIKNGTSIIELVGNSVAEPIICVNFNFVFSWNTNLEKSEKRE